MLHLQAILQGEQDALTLISLSWVLQARGSNVAFVLWTLRVDSAHDKPAPLHKASTCHGVQLSVWPWHPGAPGSPGPLTHLRPGKGIGSLPLA